MAAYLQKTDNNQKISHIEKLELAATKLTIGCGPGNQVVIPWEGEDQGYLAIERREDGYYYLQTFGLPVYLNGCVVTLLARLQHRDSVRIGDQYHFQFFFPDGQVATVPQSAHQPDPALQLISAQNLSDASKISPSSRSKLVRYVVKEDSTANQNPNKTVAHERVNQEPLNHRQESGKKIAAEPAKNLLSDTTEPFFCKDTQRLGTDKGQFQKKLPKIQIKKAAISASESSPVLSDKEIRQVKDGQGLAGLATSTKHIPPPPTGSFLAPAEAEMTLVWDSKSTTIKAAQASAELISPANGQVLSLAKDKIIVGRRTTCDICLLDDYISREHLEFTRTQLGFLLKNIGKNEIILERKSLSGAGKEDKGVWEEKLIAPGESSLLGQEAAILLGRQILYYFDQTDAQSGNEDVSARERRYNFYKHLAEQKQELLRASQLQKIVTPSSARFDHLHLGVWFRYFAIGDLSGDFFLCHNKQESLFLCMGDVSGHGAASALWASQISGMFKILAQEKESPHDMLSCMNDHLLMSKSHKKHTLYSLTTVVKAMANRLDLCIAGNSVPPLYYRAKDDKLVALDTPSTPIGMMASSHFKTYSESLEFGPQDMLLLFTDGVTEAEMHDGVQVEYERVQKQMEAQIRDRVGHDDFLDVFLAWLNQNSEIQDDLSIVLLAHVV